MKFLDYTGLSHLVSEIKARYVQKVTGKDLSTNDFTNLLKDKLDGIESGAQVNEVSAANLAAHTEATGNVHGMSVASTTVHGMMSSGDKVKLDAIESGAETNIIESIKRNNTVLPVAGDKSVDITVPTKYSDLTNDLDYQTKTQILTLIGDNGRLKKQIVESLPAVGDADDNTLYLVASEGGSGYAEWMVIGGDWEKIGDTGTIDLTDYVKFSDLTAITDAEITALFNAA